MTENEFRQLLEQFDWYYQMSDDTRRFVAGAAQENNIKNLCSKNKHFADIFEIEKRKRWT